MVTEAQAKDAAVSVDADKIAAFLKYAAKQHTRNKAERDTVAEAFATFDPNGHDFILTIYHDTDKYRTHVELAPQKGYTLSAEALARSMDIHSPTAYSTNDKPNVWHLGWKSPSESNPIELWYDADVTISLTMPDFVHINGNRGQSESLKGATVTDINLQVPYRYDQ